VASVFYTVHKRVFKWATTFPFLVLKLLLVGVLSQRPPRSKHGLLDPCHLGQFLVTFGGSSELW
jgi:hypothetical protein